jgi:isopenicillin-N N-acyltransferase like protein
VTKTYTKADIPIIKVAGSPYECGRQYGKEVSQLIKKNIAVYARLFQFHTKLDRTSAITKAEEYIPVINNYDEDIMSEIRGIADGSGTSLGEIVMLNTRMELLSKAPIHECTSMAVVPPASRDNHIWLAQNWDWLQVTKGLSILLKVKQQGKPEVTMLVEAGHVGKMGFNETGLGLCVNWLGADKQKIGVPFIVLCRAILNSEQIIDATNALYRCERAVAGNFMLGHKSGFAIDFETTSDDIDFIEPSNGILVHSNHFISARLRLIDNGLKNRGGDSLVRRQLAEKFLTQELGNIDKELLVKIQRDESCGPYSICTTPAEDEPELARWSTLAGVIMNLSLLEMYIAYGTPSETNYLKIC